MKALVYRGPRDIAFETVPDPGLKEERDAIIKVDKCAICGSDLHIYHGETFSEDTGYCVGHEAVGEVVETGRSVHQLKVGDKVMISAAVGCGQCRACLAGVINKCETNSGSCYGLSSALQGSQAEFVRVPAADFNAAKIPEGITTEQALLMTDAMATAWFGVRNADIARGATVAVVGLGPIGLMAAEGALAVGASRVFGIDLVEERRAMGRSIGLETPDPETARDYIREATKGRMCDSVIEAVGHADQAINLCISLVRPGGRMLYFGVPPETIDGVRWQELFLKNLTVHTSVNPAFDRDFPLAMRWIGEGRVDGADHLPLHPSGV